MRIEEMVGTKRVYKKVQFGYPEKAQVEKPSGGTWLINYITMQAAGDNRFKWLALTMIMESVIITPFTVLMIILFGNYPFAWFVCTAAMYMVFVPGLSGFPTKTIMKTFIGSLATDFVLILAVALLYLLT